RDVTQIKGPNYEAIRAVFTVVQFGRQSELVSERRFYPISRSQTTEAGIGSSILGNQYVAIGDEQTDARGRGLVVRVYWHPLVGWIWAGGLMMALGGAASLSDRRFRIGAPMVRAVLPNLPLPAGMAPAE
uniref:cytochrome c-type biogenesis CcmF C-terminal domain-containing protein n=1 Tax=Sandarakinorhabdus sp. TaxID=1916663 RepID=UPI00286E280D